MITLTTALQIVSGLSGSSVAYNKIKITSIQFDLVGQGLTANFSIVVSTDGSKPPIQGTLVIATTPTPGAQISIPQLSIDQQFAITGPQATAVQGIMSDFQNTLETALINQGVVTGTQTAGQ